ncbi:MAG: hypothetical protein ACYC5G_04985 [Candidatus Doudnabacteria bacterium]
MVKKMLGVSALFLVSLTAVSLVSATAGELEREVAQSQTRTIYTQKTVEKQGKVLGLMHAALVACGTNDPGCIDSGGGGGSTATPSSCVITSFEADGKSYTQSPVSISVSGTGLANATFTWVTNGCHHTKFTQTTNGISSTNVDSASGTAIVNPFFISWSDPAGADASTYTIGGYDSSDRLIDSKTIQVVKTTGTPATPPPPSTPGTSSSIMPTIAGEETVRTGTSNSYSIFANDIIDSYNGGQMKYTLNWGDGSSSTSGFFAAGVSTYIAEHTWSTSGTYTITGTAIPTVGSSAETTLQVVVSNTGSTPPSTPPPSTPPVVNQTSLIIDSGVRRDDTIIYSKSTNIKTGENILVRTKITNTGSTAATGIVVKAPLPNGYATYSWAPSPNSEAFTSEGLEIPDIAPGAFRVIDFGPIQVGKLSTSTFTISATSTNSPSVSDTITVNAGLGLTPTVQDMNMILRVSKLYGSGNYDETINANVGEALVFLITAYAGPGISNAKNVKVTVTSPDGLKVSTTNGGDPNFVSGLSNGNTATTTLGDLYPNVGYSTSFVATVTKDGPQSVGVLISSDNLPTITGSIGINGAETVGSWDGYTGGGTGGSTGATPGTPSTPGTPTTGTPATPPTQSGPCKINSFTTNQTSVNPGQIIVLSWATQGCNTVRVARDISASINEVPLSSNAIGSVNVGPINGSVTFRVYGSKSQSSANWGFNIDVQKDVRVSLIGSSSTGTPTPPPVPVGSAHSSGSNVISGSTVYFISADGKKRPYTSGGAFLSYGFNSWSDVKEATDGDLALPTGSFVPPMDGSLINDKGTIYIITNGKRLGVSSDSIFRALGYSYRNVMPGDTSFMTTIGPVTSSDVSHPSGTLVNDNGTEYLNTCNGKLGIPTNEVFFSWGFSYAKDVFANAADRALQVLGLMTQKGNADLSPTANTCQ